MDRVLHERLQALVLLEEAETALQTAQQECIGFESRLFELAAQVSRGPNGHAWMKDLPERENASKFYQLLRELVRWRAERTKAIR